MPTADTQHQDAAPLGVVDLVVNRLFRVGLDLHRALALVGPQHDPQAGQRIRMAMGRVDETIDEVRHAIMQTSGHR